MDIYELSVSLQKSVTTLADCWLFKLVVSAYLAIAGSVHGNALGAFVMLIFLDLFTRWVAIGRKHLIDTGNNGENPNIYDSLMDIPAAFKAGYINSSSMKHRFAGKLILYGALTIMAANVDILLVAVSENPVMMKTTWIYLVATEVMSILENLREAGVEQAGSILVFIRGKWRGWLEKNK